MRGARRWCGRSSTSTPVSALAPKPSPPSSTIAAHAPAPADPGRHTPSAGCSPTPPTSARSPSATRWSRARIPRSSTKFTTAEQLLTARGEARSQRAASNSDYHLTGRIRCPHCHKGFIGTAAHGRTKTYRYYTCWTRARYGTTTCPADRINADAADEALFANLAAFYRHQRHLIAEAAHAADTARHAATERHRTELTAVEKDITRTATAADRYLTAFEDNTLDQHSYKTDSSL